MADTTVKYFNNLQTNAPALFGTAGSMVSLLSACLVDGFNTVTLTSLVVSGNVATGTVSAGHGFTMNGNVGPVIKLSGATLSAFNTEWRIASIPTAQTFTFATTGISNQTAAGTITAKMAPAGWIKPYTGTNKAVFRSSDVTGTRLFLRVNDANADYALVSGYATMSSVDVGTGAFNGGGTGKWFKNSSGFTGAHTWQVIADSKFFYIFLDTYEIGYSYNADQVMGAFGDPIFNIVDPYGCVISSTDSYDYQWQLGNIGASGYMQCARSYTQLGSPVALAPFSHSLVGSVSGSGYMSYPSVIDGNVYFFPVYLLESSHFRSTLPGLYFPGHTITSAVLNASIVSNVEINSVFKELVACRLRDLNATILFIDISGPWR